MGIKELITYLQAVGPFTAPVCVVMAVATLVGFRWINNERLRERARAEKAEADATQLREKRATDLEKAAREFAQFGEAQRMTLAAWTEAANRMLK